jgi:ubiquinone biosynthesis protein
MFDWTTLVDEASLAAVLSAEYARFARPVSESLVLFLEGLPEEQQAAIIARQFSLPESASIGERLAAVARVSPVLHKLGQVLARDQRLAHNLRENLRELESLQPTTPDAMIQDAVQCELGPLNCLGIRLNPPAIAEASVAVVIPFLEFKRPNGALLDGGVLKVLKPGIEERLVRELELLSKVGAYLDERCEELRVPKLDYEDLFNQIRDKLLCEVRLEEEQRNLTRAAAFYTDERRVQIPGLLPYCTSRITAMQRVRGQKVGDSTVLEQRDRGELARLIIRALIAGPIFASGSQSMFHADPHAGNLMLTDDGRLAILDWSLVGSLSAGDRVAIMQIVLAAIALRSDRIAKVLESLHTGKQVDCTALSAVVQAWVTRVRHGTMPGVTWLIGMLDDAVQNAGFRPAANLMLFRKSLYTLEGVVTEVGGGHLNTDEELFSAFSRQFAAEWPWRFFTSPSSRAFGSHVSTQDLFEVALDSPWAAARFWMGRCRDLMDASRKTTTLPGGRRFGGPIPGADSHVANG